MKPMENTLVELKTDIISNQKLFKEKSACKGIKGDPINAVEILRWISPLAGMGAKLILAIYFFNRYYQEKGKIPLVWGFGFFFFGLSQIPILLMRYFQDINTNMAFALIASSIAALSLALIYYGASLLLFTKGSFMREKLTIISFVSMMAVILMFPLAFSPAVILRNVFLVVSSGFIFPMLLMVAAIFLVIWHRLEPDNPRKSSVLVVAVALFVFSVGSGVTSTFFGRQFDWVFSIMSMVSFLMLLYGMIMGKATGH
jgi:hypothetical protein